MSYKLISIVGSGEDYNDEKLIKHLRNSDFIIASDGGLNTLNSINIKPNLLIGDFDSVNKDILSDYPDIQVEKYPKEKDLTDSELALKKAISLTPQKIELFAMTGSYFDHSIANVFNLIRNFSTNIQISIISSNSTIFVIDSDAEFTNLKNRRVSFFPLGDIELLEMTGFKYNFDKNKISFLEYSVSNVIQSDYCKIKIKNGYMIFVLFDEDFI
ncbi:MAG: thiamine diphosphokinase [Spirochaetes bacterium GWD1_27_9]|nr:MAG: thiamine diphosphokinase [Spirochaetes bacterium GWB1_27_13]OHD27157.1 MAG: thiamine diphosphokinase [Spirochaetes bacterium GWC1_27_15]OHD29258.1 MAG: thiamine diphosphokinase [Spirochaetes bacterium GWD1_27_9]